jgi:hypothetical protein
MAHLKIEENCWNCAVNSPEKIVFFLSTSRTGTRSLAEGLMRDDAISPHQPPFSRLLTIASNYHLHGWLSKAFLKWLVCRLREPQIFRSDYRYYLQVFSLDYLPAKLISEKYSNVYIFHIVRDPRTFVPSYQNWMHSRFKSYVANKYVLGWHPSGRYVGEMTAQAWRQMDEFQRICWHWRFKNTLLERLFKEYKNYQRIRFEDLFSEKGEDTLRSVLAFAGISYHSGYAGIFREKKNISSAKTFPAWEQWSPEKQRQLLDICREGMQKYGYL